MATRKATIDVGRLGTVTVPNMPVPDRRGHVTRKPAAVGYGFRADGTAETPADAEAFAAAIIASADAAAERNRARLAVPAAGFAIDAIPSDLVPAHRHGRDIPNVTRTAVDRGRARFECAGYGTGSACGWAETVTVPVPEPGAVTVPDVVARIRNDSGLAEAFARFNARDRAATRAAAAARLAIVREAMAAERAAREDAETLARVTRELASAGPSRYANASGEILPDRSAELAAAAAEHAARLGPDAEPVPYDLGSRESLARSFAGFARDMIDTGRELGILRPAAGGPEPEPEPEPTAEPEPAEDAEAIAWYRAQGSRDAAEARRLGMPAADDRDMIRATRAYQDRRADSIDDGSAFVAYAGAYRDEWRDAEDAELATREPSTADRAAAFVIDHPMHDLAAAYESLASAEAMREPEPEPEPEAPAQYRVTAHAGIGGETLASVAYASRGEAMAARDASPYAVIDVRAEPASDDRLARLGAIRAENARMIAAAGNAEWRAYSEHRYAGPLAIIGTAAGSFGTGPDLGPDLAADPLAESILAAVAAYASREPEPEAPTVPEAPAAEPGTAEDAAEPVIASRDAFARLYAAELARAAAERPAEYGPGASTAAGAEIIARRMTAALAAGTANVGDSLPLRRLARSLGIRHSARALYAFVGGLPEHGPEPEAPAPFDPRDAFGTCNACDAAPMVGPDHPAYAAGLCAECAAGQDAAAEHAEPYTGGPEAPAETGERCATYDTASDLYCNGAAGHGGACAFGPFAPVPEAPAAEPEPGPYVGTAQAWNPASGWQPSRRTVIDYSAPMPAGFVARDPFGALRAELAAAPTAAEPVPEPEAIAAAELAAAERTAAADGETLAADMPAVDDLGIPYAGMTQAEYAAARHAAILAAAEPEPMTCPVCGTIGHGMGDCPRPMPAPTCLVCAAAGRSHTAEAHRGPDVTAAHAAMAAILEPEPEAPAPSAPAADGRPTCPRCGQTFRKSGAGLAWHLANRPDCKPAPIA